MNPKVPQETITLIFGQLNGVGDPDQLGKGYKHQNGIQGQLEAPAGPGNRYLKSTPMKYTAEVVEKGDGLAWEIKNIVLVESGGTKLTW